MVYFFALKYHILKVLDKLIGAPINIVLRVYCIGLIRVCVFSVVKYLPLVVKHVPFLRPSLTELLIVLVLEQPSFYKKQFDIVGKNSSINNSINSLTLNWTILKRLNTVMKNPYCKF